MLSTPISQAVVPPGDPALRLFLGNGETSPNNSDLVYSLWLTREKAQRLLADLSTLFPSSRFAGVVESTGVLIYIYSEQAGEGLMPLLLEYGDYTQQMIGRLPEHPAWACGAALWRLLARNE